MFIFLLQLRHMVEGHPELYLFAVYSALIWGLWVLKVVISWRYRPFTGRFRGTTSVVVPVVDEPLDLFRDVIGRMVEQRPDEIIVVINGAPNPGLVEVCEEFAPLVRWVHTPVPGKRNAVRIGTELSTGDITVLVDSDTVWTDGTLAELVKPFADPSIGGVTTRQRILQPERSWITRWADWLENSRALYSMPAQSVLGQVGCLPGRTIAFRRHILMRVMPDFMTQRFLGVFLEVSDDRTLTNLTLKAGYRTVYQYTSLVYTDAPLKVKKLFKQQLRWARGSQYNTLRMLPWMLGHAPVLALFFVMDIILPFLLWGVIAGWTYRAFTGQGYNFYAGFLEEYGLQSGVIFVACLMVASSVISMAIRQLRHLSEKPSDFFRLPAFILVSTFFLMPVRLLGFFRLAHASGWGTRDGAYAGGDAPVEGSALPGPHESSAGEIQPAPIGAGGTATLTRPAPSAVRATALHGLAPTPRPRRRRLNPLAAIPYLIGTAVFVLEAMLLV
ncbi:glycosyltransferase family 2 protein [Homoserinibacter sp. GY 40078]|uniref:glycosyltransferase family 2 protein n=1 Tax=Homoserinibacter sp. GY 40078 TaxID=2603275 RepID=UPI0011CC67FD|nr:glycosyltransferase family 2 protein [Homoserinibacter sp. GY 40078]TXK17466.1 glycosyltransferase [Homoserinibacter sp. GY 40078]